MEIVMKYTNVKWDHHNPNIPIEIFRECDNDYWETRKIEYFRDGKIVIASIDIKESEAMLSDRPFTPNSEMSKIDGYFEKDITVEQFDSIWEKVTKEQRR